MCHEQVECDAPLRLITLELTKQRNMDLGVSVNDTGIYERIPKSCNFLI